MHFAPVLSIVKHARCRFSLISNEADVDTMCEL